MRGTFNFLVFVLFTAKRSFDSHMKSPLLPMSSGVPESAVEDLNHEQPAETSVPMEDVEYFDSYEDLEVV